MMMESWEREDLREAASRIEALEETLLQIDHRLEFFNDRSWTMRPGLILERIVEVSLIAREALDGAP
jgi:hypothetical protein